MKKVEIIEKIFKGEEMYRRQVNYSFFNAYISSKRNNLEILNFDSHIWKNDVPAIITHCKEFGIEEITISNTSSELIDVLVELENAGCKMAGFVKVNVFGYEYNAIKIQMAK